MSAVLPNTPLISLGIAVEQRRGGADVPVATATAIGAGLGGYKFRDFTLVGLPLTLVTLIVTPIVVPLVLGT